MKTNNTTETKSYCEGLPSNFEDAVTLYLDSIKNMLIEKNRKYGNSALKPIRVFSSADSVEQIKVRIDDKLSRMKNQQNDDDEDIELDLIGYLVLLKIAKEDIKYNKQNILPPLKDVDMFDIGQNR